MENTEMDMKPPYEETSPKTFRNWLGSPMGILFTMLFVIVGMFLIYSATTSVVARMEYKKARNYADGNGVERNLENAFKWYREAASTGLAKAQYKVGLCYEKGEGVGRNMDEAAKWWRKAARQNYRHAVDALEKNHLPL